MKIKIHKKKVLTLNLFNKIIKKICGGYKYVLIRKENGANTIVAFGNDLSALKEYKDYFIGTVDSDSIPNILIYEIKCTIAKHDEYPFLKGMDSETEDN